jgi:glutamate decarboxylase
MAPDAEHVHLLRVVIREDFSCTLAQRLVKDIERVLEYLDNQPSAGAVAKDTAVSRIVGEDSRTPFSPRSGSIALRTLNIWKKSISDKKSYGVC